MREEAEFLLARTYRDLQAPGSDACPDAEALVELVLGETPAGKRESLADHVVSCRRCSENHQILARTNEEAAPRIRAERSFPVRWVAVAAVVLAAAGAVLV